MVFCQDESPRNEAMSNASKRRIVVAITGATGAIYGVRLLQALRGHGGIETHLVVSKAGFLSAVTELDLGTGRISGTRPAAPVGGAA